ncbi:MAG: hypothetical protein ACLVJB_04775 [Christensenellales bacterium]
MNEWARSIQTLVDEIDRCIKQQDDDALTLARLSERMGYSRFYVSRQFRAISGMQLGIPAMVPTACACRWTMTVGFRRRCG